MCRNLFLDKAKLFRSETLSKTTLQPRLSLVKFANFVRTSFLQNTTGRLLLIIAVSIVVKRKLAKETVYYDKKTIAQYQFELELLLKRAVQVKERVSEAVVCRLQISNFNLQLYLKETLTQGLSYKICKISKNTFFFTKQLQCLLLSFNSCFQRSPEQKPVRL